MMMILKYNGSGNDNNNVITMCTNEINFNIITEPEYFYNLINYPVKWFTVKSPRNTLSTVTFTVVHKLVSGAFEKSNIFERRDN